MEEKATTPYPERTGNVTVLVCEPATEYGKTIVYQGTTITNALKDYYAFTTNREKVDVLKWIVSQPNFTELKRLSLAENKIYTLYTNQYDEILKTGETPNNLQIAQKFVSNGYDVFLLSNPKATKSADFIIRQKNKVFYVEGKTSSGGSALSVRLSDGAKQADRIAVNFYTYPALKDLLAEIQFVFERNSNLKQVILFKGSRLISVERDLFESTYFEKQIKAIWNRKK
ncbi:MAG: hypothetical protein J6Y55_03500 [Bacteroidales bacterium]|nr:hypothetical protein [Bacteroidales bacterium]